MNNLRSANSKKAFCLKTCLKYSVFIFIGATFWALLAIDIFSLKKQHNHDGETTWKHIRKLMILNLIILLTFNVIAPMMLVWMNCQEINKVRNEALKEGFQKILENWNRNDFSFHNFSSKVREKDMAIVLTSTKLTNIETDFYSHVGQKLCAGTFIFSSEKVRAKVVPPFAIPTGVSEDDSLVIIQIRQE